MKQLHLINIIESLLLTIEKPLSIAKMQQMIEQPTDKEQIKDALTALQKRHQNHSITVKESASGFTFQIQQQYFSYVETALQERKRNFTQATLEILAIIAYKQPVTRGDIEAIRGVASSSLAFQNLMQRNLIKTAGYRATPGKPALYVTTPSFLDYFNLKTIKELPQVLTEPQDNNAT